jgi:hypothetical protein
MALTSAAVLILGFLLGEAPLRFAAAEIDPAGGDYTGHWFGDFDGDGLSDLALGLHDAERGRRLEIHLQRPDGKFPAASDRRVEVKRDIIAFANADLRPEPGDELLFFTRGAIFSYASAKADYSGNAEKALDWELICEVPDPKRLLRIERLGPEAEFLVPGAAGFGHLALVESGGRRTLVERARLPAPSSLAIGSSSKGGGGRLDFTGESGFSFETRKAFEDLLLDARAGARGRLIDSEHWMDAPALADVDGDGKDDWVIIESENKERRLSVRLRLADGSFSSEAQRSGPLPDDGRLRLEDLDGDRRADLWSRGEEDKDGIRLRFYRNRGGEFRFDAPEQVLKVSGRGIEVEAVDLDGDRRLELAVSSFEVPATGALGEVKVTRALVIYRGEAEGFFGRRPASRIEETFSAREFKGLAQRIRPGVALGGAPARAALLVERDGAASARRFDAQLRLESEPFWRHVPRWTILELHAHELNGDGRTDVVLRHLRSLTILVSRP